MASKTDRLSIKETFSGKLIGKDGEVNVEDIVANADLIGLYFSAHWCPPCRGFTPVLGDFYKKAKLMQQEKKLEIIFVSSDRDEESFDGYFKDMPWIALKYSDRDTKGKLGDKYGVRGIPTLVILDKEGNELTKDGRSGVTENAEGKIPW